MKVNILYKNDTDFFRNLVEGAIKVREERQIMSPGIINALIEARKGRFKHDIHQEGGVTDSEISPEKQKRLVLSDEDITAQSVVFIFAGYDTTATVLCLMAYELAKNPKIQDTLHNEIEENCLDGITYETVVGMKYLDCVVSGKLLTSRSR